ncbi:S41 family peptidase [Candidatus Margulisiibacteriota bacterium]
MSKILKKTKSFIVIVVLISIAFFVGNNFEPIIRNAEAAAWESNWGLLYQVLDIIKTQYVQKKVEDKNLIYGAIKGMLKALGDPYSRFVEPKAFEEMQIRLDGKFAGVGIQIGIKDEHLTVISPIEGTPAFRMGLKAMDRIIKVDGKDTEGMSLEEAVSRIRGPRGTKVTLTILRKGKKEPFDVDIVRDIIKIKSVPKAKMIDNRYKIGYIQLATFENKTATEEVENALANLDKEGIRALVLDVRNNGGGLLRNSVDIASIFIKKGAVVHTVDRDGNRETLEVIGTETKFYKRPLIVLINEGSASASEILAGAIQDHRRGTLVGAKSFGKASVQNIRPLSDGSAVLITVAKYLTPKGYNISEQGISPNIFVTVPTATIEAASKDDYEYKEKDDIQLQRAIKILQNKIGKPSGG